MPHHRGPGSRPASTAIPCRTARSPPNTASITGPTSRTIPDAAGAAAARTGFTLLTQGCPFRCSFCVIWPANLGLYRKRPIPEIVADLKSMEEAYIYLGDDNTFADAKYAGELADAIRDAGIKKEISSYCRADHICKHPDLMQKWYDIGLRYLVIGVEAVNTEKLKLFNKKTDQEQNVKSLQHPARNRHIRNPAYPDLARYDGEGF